MNKTKLEILVGGFVLLGGVALVFLALKAANLGKFSGSGNSITVTANFDNVGGLKQRAPVRSAGVRIGQVTSIGIDPQTYQGKVTMQLDSSMPFPKDSSAKILTSGLLGDQYIGLEAGGDTNNLANGDVIRQTQSAVVLENLIGQFLFNKAAEGSNKPAASAP